VSRISVRGILTDAHNEIARTQIEALNSTFQSNARTTIDDYDLEEGEDVERIDQGSSTNYRRIRT